MQYLAFNPVLPYGENPEPVVYENGKPVLRLYEKGAQRVTLTVAEKEYPFAKSSEQEDVFTLQLPFATGINYVQIAADGREVLTPLLPIGYGYSRPYNYIELRTPDDDWYQLRDVPHGCVHVEHFFSKVTGEWERCTIYTPPSFDEHPEKTYPVLYLQHGHGENETGWIATGRANLILDNLIAAGKAVPFVMVMNNGMVQKKNDAAPCGHVVDHLLFEPMLLQDVIPFVESKYHCGGKKALRGMAGLSMGSVQTSMLVCRHPEMFSEAGIFSGFLRDLISGSALDGTARRASANQHLEALRGGPEFRKQFHTFFRAIGDHDHLLAHFLEDDELLKEDHFEAERKIYPGIHDWNVWRMCLRDFAQMIFKD